MPGGGIRICFAGGGTGGHVFPGVALAQRLPQDDVFWLCTPRPFDAPQLTRAGIAHRALSAPRWRSAGGFLVPMARAILDAAGELKRFRPDVLVGVGGYGTVPPVIAAKALGIPYVLLEQNVRPGKANRFLAPGAKRLYVQWAEARGAFPGCGSKTLVTGSPLRRELRRVERSKALERFGLDASRPVLGVVGGSQGAEAINRAVVDSLDGTASRIQIIHQTGRGNAGPVREAYAARGARAEVLDFVDDMDAFYSASDLVISRAGAMAIAELAAFGVPAVLVPIGRSSGDHQRENARAAARGGGAVLVEERDCAAGALTPILRRLADRDASLDAMRARIGAAARSGAAEAILEDLRKEVLR
jgi:UDP-N-acetylglucosamine--N-acetylmuramyl-(pentapeptide) pyrophosphoryl-undecaprenol N-acetylglucosamine transferase